MSSSIAAAEDPLSRREFLKKTAGAVGALAVTPVAAANDPAANPTSTARPNFVFIMTNGHRSSALSLAGNPVVQTPNLDRIGREGIQLQQAFVVNALCLPSRATALTGLYSHTTGCVDNS